MKRNSIFGNVGGTLAALAMVGSVGWAADKELTTSPSLNEAGKRLEAQYADEMEKLRVELAAKIPAKDQATGELRCGDLCEGADTGERIADRSQAEIA